MSVFFRLKFVFIVAIFSFISCSIKPTYYQSQKKAFDYYVQKKFDSSIAEIESNKYLAKSFNKNLYHIEKAKLLFENKQFDKASKLFIKASENIEDWNTFYFRDLFGHKVYLNDTRYSIDKKPLPPPPKNFDEAMDQGANGIRGSYGFVKQITLKSPHKTEYISADYERPLINYYSGLCGLNINKDLTLVEAKRLILLYDRLNTRKTPFTNKTFSPNPFIQLCAGIFYEATGNINDAFIAYEKSLNDFENENCLINYGLKTPNQMKLNLLRTSKLLRFDDKTLMYKNKFPELAELSDSIEEGIIVLIEVNHSPRKQFSYLETIDSSHMERPLFTSYPYIEKVSEPIDEIIIEANNKKFDAELINNLQYMLTNVCAERIKNDYNSIINKYTVNDRFRNYDTRNWQTLPAQIFYSRIDSKKISFLNIKYKVDNNWKYQKVEIAPTFNQKVIRIFITD